MCGYLYLLTLCLFVYHVTAEVPKLRNILTNNHHLYQTEKRNEEGHEEGHEMSHEQGHELENEVYFTVPQLQALKEQFRNYIDKNGDEKASFQEVYEYLQKYNPDISIKKVKDFMKRRDINGDGSVDFVPDYLLEVSSPDYAKNTAREWFELEDTNGDGLVSRDELIKIAVNVGMPREEAEQTAVGYYMSADRNGDGKLTWKEYSRLYSE